MYGFDAVAGRENDIDTQNEKTHFSLHCPEYDTYCFCEFVSFLVIWRPFVRPDKRHVRCVDCIMGGFTL